MRAPIRTITLTAAVLTIGLAAPVQAAEGDEAKTEAAPAPALAAPSALAGYDKGFFLKSADDAFKLVLQGRVQSRLTWEGPEGGDDAIQFSIPRARLTLKGNAFSKDLTYKFQVDFSKGGAGLKDFYADYRFVKGLLHLRVGQWKRPLSRQQIASSSVFAFVERAITDKGFGSGRDIGLALHNNYEKSPGFEYAFGVFNGDNDGISNADKPKFSGSASFDPVTGESEISSKSKFTNIPETFDPMLVVRAGWNHGGIDGYNEADLEGGGLRVAIGASVLFDPDLDADGDGGGLTAELDYALMIAHFSTTGGVYVASSFDNEDGGLQATGFHLQAGYVIAKLVQPALRYARVMPEGGDPQQEIALGVSVFLHGQAVSWQTDAAALTEGEGDAMTTDWRVRSQLQLAF